MMRMCIIFNAQLRLGRCWPPPPHYGVLPLKHLFFSLEGLI